jgi:hypothetical protein
MAQLPDVLSFYERNIDLGSQLNPRGFISPVSDNAFLYYKFRLDGDFQQDGQTIFKIRVTPRRPFEPVFSGFLFIADNDFAIHSLDLLLTSKSSMQLLDTFSIRQLYVTIAKDVWVIKQQVYEPKLTFLGFKIKGDFVTVYNNQKINDSVATVVNDNKVISTYSDDALSKSSALYKDERPLPLLEDEKVDFHRRDSIATYKSSDSYKDSVRKVRNKLALSSLLSTGYEYFGRGFKTRFEVAPLLIGAINYNTVEGLNLSPNIKLDRRLDSAWTLRTSSTLRYGFSNQHFNGISKLTVTKEDRRWKTRKDEIGLLIGSYVDQLNNYEPIPPLFNTISTLAYGKNYIKVYERLNVAAAYTHNFGTGIEISGSASWQKRQPLINTTDYSLKSANESGFSSNLPRELSGIYWKGHNAFLLSIHASWQPGVRYVKYPGFLQPVFSDAPLFSARVTRAIPDVLKSAVDYTTWTVSMRHAINVKLLGYINYRLSAGGFFDKKLVSIPDLNHVYGNQFFTANPYLRSFQLAPYYALSNASNFYCEVHVEWGLGGLGTNKIPLIRNLNWSLILGGNAYHASASQYHVEAFAGFENVGFGKFRFFRVDYIQGYNPVSGNVSGFRIGFNPAFIRFSSSEPEYSF